MDLCCLCKKVITSERKGVELTSKGSDGVNRASVQRNNDLKTIPGDKVHVDCRREYIKVQNITRETAPSQPKIVKKHELRSQQAFDFRNHCLYCGRSAKFEKGKKRGIDVHNVKSNNFQESLIQDCSNRKDEWSETVLGRLASINDLHAADAIYHQQCSSNFRTGRNIPKSTDSVVEQETKPFKIGRPTSHDRSEAFLKVLKYLEEINDEPVTINDLVRLMNDYLTDSQDKAYSGSYMKEKLALHFGERLVLTTLSTKVCVVTLRQTAMSIIHDFHREQQNKNTEDEKMRIITTAARLIVSDVKSVANTLDVYPSLDTINNVASSVEYLPNTLQLLLRSMFAGKNNDIKLAAIGQAIMQAQEPYLHRSSLVLVSKCIIMLHPNS